MFSAHSLFGVQVQLERKYRQVKNTHCGRGTVRNNVNRLHRKIYLVKLFVSRENNIRYFFKTRNRVVLIVDDKFNPELTSCLRSVYPHPRISARLTTSPSAPTDLPSNTLKLINKIHFLCLVKLIMLTLQKFFSRRPMQFCSPKFVGKTKWKPCYENL